MDNVILKKICQGYYEGTYKGHSFNIVKAVGTASNETAWYYQINNGNVYDWYYSKKTALNALINYINENSY